MSYKKYFSVAALILCIIVFSSCSQNYNQSQSEISVETTESSPSSVTDFGITENKYVYENEKNEIEKIYLTVIGNTEYSLKDVNNFRYSVNMDDESVPRVEVKFESGSVSDDIFKDKPNAMLLPRGHSTGTTLQKSFKIKLFDSAGLWNEQRIINLNKHPMDITRIRNKLSFDIMKQLPDYFSLRTKFCHLYIKDLSQRKNAQFVDYGLFTHVEQPNMQYLKSRGIAQNAYIYKAENFEFFRYSDSIKNVDETDYNEKNFESRLEIKGEKDHTRLIEMLEDVNDYTKDINDVISKHFDKNNYITWMAVNILMGNIDTNSQNFILVSPVTSSKWYFMPWDYDGAWGYHNQRRAESLFASWQVEGVSNYWGVILHRRFLKDPQNVSELSKKIDELAELISKEKIQGLLDQYYSLTSNLVKSMPDLQYLPEEINVYEEEYKRIPGIIEENRKMYYDGLQKPMPIFLDEPEIKGNSYNFKWDISYDLQGDDLLYDFTIATDPGFKNTIYSKKGLRDNFVDINNLKKGIYYWKVDIYDSKGNHQIPFDLYTDFDGNKYYGITRLIVT